MANAHVAPAPKTYRVVIEMDESEARHLMSLVQNSFTPDEAVPARQVRCAIFHALESDGVRPF